MSRSIRTTLLAGTAAILVAVVATLGAFAYGDRCRTAFGRIDGEIGSQARALAATIEEEPGEGLDLEYAAEYVRRFDDAGSAGSWAAILGADGTVLLRGGEPPTFARVPAPGLRDTGEAREFATAAAGGTRVVVGCPTAATRADLRGFLSGLVAAGAGTLALGMAGAWLLADRILAPLRRISGTAGRISESNLSERIDVGRTERELADLAATLNGAFDRVEGAFARQARFTADASHELRTPLAVVISNGECGLRRERSPEEVREALDRCLRAAHRMRSLVDGLLALARADDGDAVLDRRPIDLAAVVRDGAEFLAPLAAEHGVSVTVDARAAIVPGDAERLRTVVENVVANAIRYNRPGGRVVVTLRCEDDGPATQSVPAEGGGDASPGVVLTVTDTGIGIPPDSLGRIFERFYRADPARSRRVGGSGLGLAISNWIVDAHGGRIEVTSAAGAGTTVTVRLPGAMPHRA